MSSNLSETAAESNSKTPITLQAGERRFITFRETLSGESEFFSGFFSKGWECQQQDGSYFVDIDGNIFEHTLRYLRTGIYPIFFDKTNGHDEYMYLAVSQQADFLLIPKLHKWCVEKTYRNAFKTERWLSTWESTPNSMESAKLSLRENADYEFHPSWLARKVYICPRNLLNHRGNPDACGRACRAARGDEETRYETEAFVQVLSIERRVVIDDQVCNNE